MFPILISAIIFGALVTCAPLYLLLILFYLPLSFILALTKPYR